MLFLLLMYFLTQSNPGGDASPILLLERRDDVPCNDLNQCRTIWNIIWSCLSTVILCTWVTLHPNIAIAPDTRNMRFPAKVWQRLRAFIKNKLLLFLWMLIAPEYILAWAYRQYFRAGEIQRECNTRQANAGQNPVPSREWTRTHGFFMIMGGFHLYSLPDDATSIAYPPGSSVSSKFVLPLPAHPRGGKAEHPLDFKDFSPHDLAYLAPDVVEIKDRGKADIIAKVLVLLQTTWFIAQCIARGVKGLPLTELELVTLGYALMNAFIYRCWWDKPKDVECPVRIYKAPEAGRVSSGGRNESESGALGIFERIGTYILGRQDYFCQLGEESQVPMFWSGMAPDSIQADSVDRGAMLASLCGIVTFFAWYADFPTHAELLLWRFSCVAMTLAPGALSVVWNQIRQQGVDNMEVYEIKGISYLLIFVVATLLYFFARIATWVIAFTTLQALPSGAFKTVEWINFFPHI